MKNFKIKIGLFSLLAVLAVSVFLTSCEQTVPGVQNVTDISSLTEDELLTKLNSDEDALAFVNAVEELETIMRTALDNSNTSVDMLRGYHDTSDEAALEAMLGNTEFLAVYNEVQIHADKFVQKFPEVGDMLAKFIEHESPVSNSDHLVFSNLEENVVLRGCGCCGKHFWAKNACQAMCIVSGIGCGTLTAVTVWGPYVCALGGFTCAGFCQWYYCDYL